ncbi:hypothetical protein ATCC90586_000777 [Pythium insidiosum]|nr:hypothetical protein ATCC90586_000777 [Pythium insidiosum]
MLLPCASQTVTRRALLTLAPSARAFSAMPKPLVQTESKPFSMAVASLADVSNIPQATREEKKTPPVVCPDWEKTIPHAGYDLTFISDIEQTHHKPTKTQDRLALFAVKMMRSGFDLLSGYRGPGGGMTERDWLNRCVFLETVAGVPGMVAGMARHLRSLRGMRRDYGWIHTLLEEAENERMHLLIFVKMRRPGWLFRLGVLGAQGVFFNIFFLTYLITPRTCHRFVGYLEEEAVKTYTGLLKDIEDGHLPAWKTQRPPKIARTYYGLADDSTVVDLIQCVRADEANHRDVNHTFAGLQESEVNPYAVVQTPAPSPSPPPPSSSSSPSTVSM